MPTISIDASVILPAYQQLLNEMEKYSIEFMYGGRDSAKSYTTAELLIIECLEMKYFRCALIREQFGDIKDSQWQLIKDICEDWGVSHLFTFTKAPLEIVCYNGNKFISRGCNEPQNLKSITACNRAWIEEGIKERASMTVILGTLRSNNSAIKVYYTFNPEWEGNYTTWWLYEDWFDGYYSPHNTSFTATKTFKIVAKGEEKEVSIPYRVTHTTYHDNPFVSNERIAFHESNKGYYYTVYTKGLFGYKITGGEFWKQFKPDKHVQQVNYMPKMPVHVVLDNNVLPYITTAIWQISEKKKNMRQVDELPCYPQDNSAKKAAKKLIQWLQRKEYDNVVYIYGDASANANTTVDDNNASFFEKYIETIEDAGYHVINRVGKSNPRVAMSGEFINEIYEQGFDGWTITISNECAVAIEDYTMAKEDPKTSGILKTRIKNKETGQSYEHYGHFSDTKRYFICTVLGAEFQQFADRGRRKLTYL